MVIRCLDNAGELQRRTRAIIRIILLKRVEWKKNLIFKLYRKGGGISQGGQTGPPCV